MVALDEQPGDGYEFDMSEFWGSPGNRPHNATEQRIRFARAYLETDSATKAALAAGCGKPEYAAQSGSKMLRTNAMKRLLKDAQAFRDGTLDKEGDNEEVRKVLWRHARGGNAAVAVRATEILAKYYTEKAAKDAARERSPTEILDTLTADIAGPHGAVLAALVARMEQVEWCMPGAAYEALKTEHPEIIDALLQAEWIEPPRSPRINGTKSAYAGDGGLADLETEAQGAAEVDMPRPDIYA